MKEEIVAKVGLASCGIASGAEKAFNELKKKNVRVKKVGCIGACYAEPLVEIKVGGKESIVFQNVQGNRLKEILRGLKEEKLEKEWVLGKRKNGKKWFKKLDYLDRIGFFKHQKKVLSKRCGVIRPSSLKEYKGLEGFKGLENALKLRPKEVVERIDSSKLRGRGGAGFPTGKKWGLLGNGDKPRYLICNADEGDPGAFMNRVLLESDPFSVIEGMIIAGYGLRAKKGIIYIRAEYPLAVKRLGECLRGARKEGFLGKNVFGKKFDFDIEMVLGAGAFVCGEETALIASIEGDTGRPNPRPPYPTQKGLYGMPTVINNVETFANVSLILRDGITKFKRLGSRKTVGTKIFSLSGNIPNTGYIEIPLGSKMKNVLKIGEMPKNEFKAIHLGGPAGSCFPKKKLGTRMGYDYLKKLDSVMGSGSIIILNTGQDMVEFTRDLLEFSVAESCGKCVPCREGTKQLLEITEKILHNRGKAEDLLLLERIANTVKDTSLCGLGQSCCNPLLSTIKYFKKDYVEKLQGVLSVAHRLSMYSIKEKKCIGCGKCSEVCPINAVIGREKEVHKIDSKLCIKCGRCYNACPTKAIELTRMEKKV